jgi:hypothetical protein
MIGKLAQMDNALIGVLIGNVEIVNMENVDMLNPMEIVDKIQIVLIKVGLVLIGNVLINVGISDAQNIISVKEVNVNQFKQ